MSASHLLGSVSPQSELPIVFDFDFNWRVFAYAFAVQWQQRGSSFSYPHFACGVAICAKCCMKAGAPRPVDASVSEASWLQLRLADR